MDTVYLPHFTQRYKHAGYYLGSTNSLTKRLEAHQKGQGARLLAVVYQAGITWVLARTWEGGRTRERQLKKQGGRVPPLPHLQGRTQGGKEVLTYCINPRLEMTRSKRFTISRWNYDDP